MNPKVDWFFNNTEKWQDEFEALRKVCLDCGLTEELKWGCPCYTHKGKNVVLIHGFNDYCALLFHKGGLLKDPYGILIQQTKNVQAARQVRFTNVLGVIELEAILKSYIGEAIEAEEAGIIVDFKKTEEFDTPIEFQERLDESPALKKAFEALTPGRQRGYILHFSGARQSGTRMRRVEKWIPNILKGKGMHD
jgi:uncharacterized protein YdeI (YjbR/CyaY-like superfamily)